MFDQRILEEHPLTKEYIYSVFKERIKKTLEAKQNIPEDIKEQLIEAGFDDERMLMIMNDNPSLFFNILDMQKVYLHVYPFLEGGVVMFSYTTEEVDCIKGLTHGVKGYTTRVEAERDALTDGFGLAENVLASLTLPL